MDSKCFAVVLLEEDQVQVQMAHWRLQVLVPVLYSWWPLCWARALTPAVSRLLVPV